MSEESKPETHVDTSQVTTPLDMPCLYLDRQWIDGVVERINDLGVLAKYGKNPYVDILDAQDTLIRIVVVDKEDLEEQEDEQS